MTPSSSDTRSLHRHAPALADQARRGPEAPGRQPRMSGELADAHLIDLHNACLTGLPHQCAASPGVKVNLRRRVMLFGPPRSPSLMTAATPKAGIAVRRLLAWFEEASGRVGKGRPVWCRVRRDRSSDERPQRARGRYCRRPDFVSAGLHPPPHRSDFVTSRLHVVSRGEGWRRAIELLRDGHGIWTLRTEEEGSVDLPAPGGDPAGLADALDCDLGLSPVTNLMPVPRQL